MNDKEEKMPSKKVNRLRSWGPASSVLVTIGGFVLSQIAAVIFFVIFAHIQGWDGAEATKKINDSVALTFLYSLIVYGFYLLLIKKFLDLTGHKFKEVGLRMTKSKLEIPYYVFGGYVIYFALAIATSVLVKHLLPSINFDQKQDIGIDTSTSGWPLVVVFLTLVIIPPIVEEIVCRGFLYTGLRKKLKIFGAGIVTSIIFAMAHLQWGNDAPLLWAAAIDTFVLSAVLIYVREKTNSLIPPIGIHMLKNFMAFLALFVFAIR